MAVYTASKAYQYHVSPCYEGMFLLRFDSVRPYRSRRISEVWTTEPLDTEFVCSDDVILYNMLIVRIKELSRCAKRTAENPCNEGINLLAVRLKNST